MAPQTTSQIISLIPAPFGSIRRFAYGPRSMTIIQSENTSLCEIGTRGLACIHACIMLWHGVMYLHLIIPPQDYSLDREGDAILCSGSHQDFTDSPRRMVMADRTTFSWLKPNNKCFTTGKLHKTDAWKVTLTSLFCSN